MNIKLFQTDFQCYDLHAPRKQNEYVELAEFYDLLMQSGYYDYQAFAHSLNLILGAKTKVLDIGIGTGLLTEKMMAIHSYEITGIDFSTEMLARAKDRLSDYQIELVSSDIRNYQTNDIFQAIISTGGAICISNQDNGRYRLYSYCDDKSDHIKLLHKLHDLLENNGLLVISIQGEHKSYSQDISEDVTYSQEVEYSSVYLTKWYTFLNAKEILARQFVKLVFLDEAEMIDSFSEVGFKSLGIDDSNSFYIFQK